ncbi:sn-glycerol-3-phosphate ABC transporter ATP-binding protein UgpC [Reinekea sp.]|jgi:multiple sugar transport system ATP-binding protein|uniref:ABC transporter ATP-binding protein n=1 Tax=Reinekea sp. TaxID=1970455 RepID=UPI00257ACAC3|nr:sn-glycerol-3-phosphate ABC transporter ATP-binding protein UgpC [Reinekea sp.]
MGFLDIKNVTKSYGDVEVLHDIDISIEEGEFLVLVGPSGCGKSTLLNMIAGLVEISSGEISIKDRTMNGVHPSKRNIAMVFQSYALYPNMSVAQNITFGLEMHNVEKSIRDKALADVAKLLQIEPLLDRKPGQLSGGQRQRVAMGRALVRNPDVFLFDEPLSNLDAKLRVDMRTEIKKLHEKLKTTIVYVTHDQIEAMTLSTRIAVMFKGHVQQLGTPKQIYDAPVNLYVATFMGSPSMNLLPVDVVDGPEGSQFDLKIDAQTTQTIQLKGRRLPAGHYTMGLRPEHITDPESADVQNGEFLMIESQVEVVEPAGADTFVITSLQGVAVNARMRGDIEVATGDITKFALDIRRLHFFNAETELRIDSEVINERVV